jgi:hypothetical protein
MMSGLQTLIGDPTFPLTGPLDAGCCPEGIITYFDAGRDSCCVDNTWENPYK